ncbi:MAG: oligosaccharide flippase family protein [Bacteroidota bacterium]
MVKGLFKIHYVKNIMVLITGAAVAQALSLALAPILSRLFDPGAFGILGVYVSITGIITVISGGKYELAILLPKEKKIAANVFCLTLLIVFLVSLTTLILLFLLKPRIVMWFDLAELSSLIWFIPLSIFLGGSYNALNYWNTRNKFFNNLSISRIIQAVGREGSQVGIGLISNLQAVGLTVGYLFGQFISVINLIILTLNNDRHIIYSSINIRYLKKVAKDYTDFPKYSASQSFLNSLSSNLPAILLTYYFGAATAGLYWFTHRILLAPNQLIGNAVRQAFYQKANELNNKDISTKKLFVKTTLGLASIGIIPLLIVSIFGPFLFEFAFGSEWFMAGVYSKWLIIYWFFIFINPPSVMMFPILNRQKIHLLIDSVYLVLRLIVLIIGGLKNDSILAIALFSGVGVVKNTFIIIYINFYLNSTKQMQV